MRPAGRRAMGRFYRLRPGARSEARGANLGGGVPLDSGTPAVPGWPTRPTPGPRPRIRRTRSPRPGCPLTIRSSVGFGVGAPGPARREPHGSAGLPTRGGRSGSFGAGARVRSAPRLGFVRRGGSGSFGAGSRVRSAPPLGFVRRAAGSFGAAARVRSTAPRLGPRPFRRAARVRFAPAPFGRRGSGSFGARGTSGFVRRPAAPGSFGASRGSEFVRRARLRVRSAPPGVGQRRPHGRASPPAPLDPHKAARLRTGGGRPEFAFGRRGPGSARRIGSPPCTRPGAVRNPRNREGHPLGGTACSGASTLPGVGPGHLRDRETPVHPVHPDGKFPS